MFYDTFVKLCNTEGKTPSAVGRELGISKTTIHFWKNGRSEPSDSKLMTIADHFKVDYRALKEGRVVPVQSSLDNLQIVTIEPIRSDSDRIKQTAEFAAKFALLTDNHKKLISDLIDTFLEDKK